MSTFRTDSTTIWNKQRPHFLWKKVLFHQNTASVQTCVVASVISIELNHDLLPHPPNSSERQRLFPVSKFEQMTLWKVMWLQRYNHLLNKRFFFKLPQILWSGRSRRVSIALTENMLSYGTMLKNQTFPSKISLSFQWRYSLFRALTSSRLRLQVSLI